MEVWRVLIHHLAPHSQPPHQCPEPDCDTDSQSPRTDMSVSPKYPNPSLTLEFTPTSCIGLGTYSMTHMMNHTQRCLPSKDSSSEHTSQEAVSIQEGLLCIWKESLPGPPESQGNLHVPVKRVELVVCSCSQLGRLLLTSSKCDFVESWSGMLQIIVGGGASMCNRK